MNSPDQSQIDIHITKSFKDIDVSLPRLKQLIRAVCSRFKLPTATISVAIVDDDQICKLNKKFLGRNRPTDCLSFDLSDKNTSKSFELIINAEQAVKQARLRGLSQEAELALYIIHSLLHNLGFDDTTKEKAKKMHQTEDEILQQLGFGLVYKKTANIRHPVEGALSE